MRPAASAAEAHRFGEGRAGLAQAVGVIVQLLQAPVGAHDAQRRIEDHDALVHVLERAVQHAHLPLQRRLRRGVRDRDGGRLRGDVDEPAVVLAGPAGLAPVHRKRAEHLAAGVEDGRRPAGPQAVWRGQRAVPVPQRVGVQVFDDHRGAPVGRGAAGARGRADLGPGQAGRRAVAQVAAVGVEQQHRGQHVGGQRLDEAHQLVEHLGHRRAGGDHLQHLHLAPGQGLGLPALGHLLLQLLLGPLERVGGGVPLQLGPPVQPRHQQRRGQRHQRHRAHGHGEPGVVEAGRVGRADAVGRKLGGGHAGVVHAGDAGAHHQCTGRAPAQARERLGVAQRKGDAQRGHGGGHRDHDREPEQRGVVAGRRRELHAGHARVVHGGDATAHGQAGQQQARRRQCAPARDVQRQGRHRGGDQRRGQRHGHVVGHRDRQPEGQHADEVHGPDPGAHGQRTGHQPAPGRAAAAGGGHARGELERAVRRERRHQQREQDQAGIVAAVHARGAGPAPEHRHAGGRLQGGAGIVRAGGCASGRGECAAKRARTGALG
jgi:hypothetical protein